MKTFLESGMTFSFDENDFFYIEKSKRFKKINGAKPCECVVLHGGRVLLIEAKRSTPHPKNAKEFGDYLGEIVQKFRDSYTYYCAAHQKRHTPDVVARNLQLLPLSNQYFEFYLIINGHKREWLVPVLEQLKQMMKKDLKLWGFNDACVKVVNEQGALNRGLIIGIEDRQSSK